MPLEVVNLITKITSLSVYVNKVTKHNVAIEFTGQANFFYITYFINGFENRNNSVSRKINLDLDDAESKLSDELEYLSELYMQEVRELLKCS